MQSMANNPLKAEKRGRIPGVADDAEARAENRRGESRYPQHATVPQLFEHQAGRTPDANAVVCGERSMTYRDLHRASNSLAHRLRTSDIPPNSRIAVFLDRSPELMVALLGILKSGSAYVPLDPGYPAERIAHVLDHSRPAAVVSRAALRERLPAGRMPTILVDAESLLRDVPNPESPSIRSSATDPAYIIYTSGTTGRPKGVVIHHGALINLLWAMRRQPGLTKEDTVLSVTTVSFDMAVPDLFLPLMVGARLVLASEHEMADGAALFTLLQRHQATFMQATPITWRLLLEAGWRGSPSLKMLCGGETLPRALAEQLLEGGGELWNMYGPTETTVWSSMLRVASGAGPVPIGSPLANTQFHILDSRQARVPQGEPGELYIGGDGVARGYFDLPEATREKFVTDLFSAIPGAKMYRTGDRVRMNSQGSMEYLGRTDQQIKLRGFRIEPGEIEATILQHPGIAEAVAIMGRDASGEDALLAYAVARHSEKAAPETLIKELRERLARALPGYLCPSSLMLLDALPRMPNGKIDRRALPTPVVLAGKDSLLPFDDIERRLAIIWSAVLGLEIKDKTLDFFALGGHSIHAARLLAGIEAEFGYRLSRLSLFEARSVQAQAKMLAGNAPRQYDFRQVVRLRPTGSRPPLIAVHNTGVYYYHLAGRLDADQPLTALQLFDPSLEHQKLPQTLEDIAAEYVRLIHRYQPATSYRLIGWCIGGVLAFEVARQLVAAGYSVSMLALIDSWAPGYNSSMPRHRAILADYSYRWQLIGAEWNRVLAKQLGIAEFFAQRRLVRKMLGRPDRTAREPASLTMAECRALSSGNFDQWLLGYLEHAAHRYEPKSYAGRITLFRSAQEPKGRFIDAEMGWGAYASKGVAVTLLEGDHFTVFKGRGLEQMAQHISSIL